MSEKQWKEEKRGIRSTTEKREGDLREGDLREGMVRKGVAMIGKVLKGIDQTESDNCGKRVDCSGGQTEQGHPIHCTRSLRN